MDSLRVSSKKRKRKGKHPSDDDDDSHDQDDHIVIQDDNTKTSDLAASSTSNSNSNSNSNSCTTNTTTPTGSAHAKKDKKRERKKDKKKKKDRKENKIFDTNCDHHWNQNANADVNGDEMENTVNHIRSEKNSLQKQQQRDDDDDHEMSAPTRKCKRIHTNSTKPSSNYFPFEYEHIVAPMVGASELAFRLLCRKYGATLCYTPMMSARQFSEEAEKKITAQCHLHANLTSSTTKTMKDEIIANSNICEFQTIPQDRPLVVHFSANHPAHFASAAKHVEYLCDAIDLNLGCPQRTAYLGHFGSYLLDDCDRQLVLDIVRAGARAVSIPIFVKIRLLDTVEDTLRLCQQLREAGASLIAIHARYRASWERTSAGARDGPAMLDQVALIKRSMPDFPIISNGNVISYEDVVANRKLTGADGIMSAEGILDNPALYLPRFKDGIDNDDLEREDITVQIPILSQLNSNLGGSSVTNNNERKAKKSIRKLQKKLREVETIERKVKEQGEDSINDDQRCKLLAKSKIQKELQDIKHMERASSSADDGLPSSINEEVVCQQPFQNVTLSDLMKAADNKLVLAREYLSLVRLFPTKIRSVVFHIRRMCKSLLDQYQLMEECIACTTIDDVESVLRKCEQYIQNPTSFHYDREKAKRDKEALASKRREEGKRKAYEERMTRKAKREGLSDLGHYLRIGVEVPTVEVIAKLKSVSNEDRMTIWKKDHSQHCMAFHFDNGGCKRDRACAFLHVEAKDSSKFVADDEVAG